MSSYRYPFTPEEDRKILDYIFRSNGFHRLRGLQFWKELQRDELPSRTYWSLHERFKKQIITNIKNPAYGLSFEEQIKLKRIYDEGGRQKNVSTKSDPLPVCSVETEIRGNLARNFFEISDSDDSDRGEISSKVPRKSNSYRNNERTRSNENDDNTMLKNEEMKSTLEENSIYIVEPNTSVIEVDSSNSSCDSEVFNLQVETNFN